MQLHGHCQLPSLGRHRAHGGGRLVPRVKAWWFATFVWRLEGWPRNGWLWFVQVGARSDAWSILGFSAPIGLEVLREACFREGLHVALFPHYCLGDLSAS